MLSQKKMSGDDNTLCRVTIIPDSSFSFTAAAAAFLPAAYQRQPLCLSLPPPTSTFSTSYLPKLPSCLYFSLPSFPLCPASANPSGQTALFFFLFSSCLFIFFFFYPCKSNRSDLIADKQSLLCQTGCIIIGEQWVW